MKNVAIVLSVLFVLMSVAPVQAQQDPAVVAEIYSVVQAMIWENLSILNNYPLKKVTFNFTIGDGCDQGKAKIRIEDGGTVKIEAELCPGPPEQ